ncbi:transposase [Arthrobacter sp. TMP15]|uniref:transposase n=1 Tax=Arthrobacter sp. TMP15 TaxID=3140789 RepID=UPI0031BA692F
MKVATLDPFRGYANAIRDELPEAITVVDAFHIVRLGMAMLDDVRRRVQQDTLGHRGNKEDPLFNIRRTLQQGIESLSEKQVARLEIKLKAGDPNHEVSIAWQCYQKLRSIYHARLEKGREIATEIIASFPSCPILRSCPARTQPTRLEGCDPCLLRHQRCLERAHRINQRCH